MRGAAMRRKVEVARLRAIIEIRGLQRVAAEIEATRAAEALRKKDEQKDRAEHERQSSEERWLSAVQAPAISLDFLPMWSADLLRETENARLSAVDAEAA